MFALSLILFLSIIGILLFFDNKYETKLQATKEVENYTKDLENKLNTIQVNMTKKEQEQKEQVQYYKKQLERRKPVLSYKDIMAYLNNAIQQEIDFKYEMDYKFRQIKVIHSFTDDFEELSKAVIEGISLEVWNDLSYYHTREWICSYIIRNVELYLIKNINLNRDKPTDPNMYYVNKKK